MGRNAAKELARIVGAISDYLDSAAADPALPLTYEAIEHATGHLSRGPSRPSDPRRHPRCTVLGLSPDSRRTQGWTPPSRPYSYPRSARWAIF